MRGIADGAGVHSSRSRAQLPERADVRAAITQGKTPPGECSLRGGAQASADGHMLLGQNWDWVPFARGVRASEVRVTTSRIRDDRRSGMLGEGRRQRRRALPVHEYALSERETRQRGVPYHVMLRALLDAESVEEAQRVLSSVERALSRTISSRTSLASMNFDTIAGGAAQIVATRPHAGLLARQSFPRAAVCVDRC